MYLNESLLQILLTLISAILQPVIFLIFNYCKSLKERRSILSVILGHKKVEKFLKNINIAYDSFLTLESRRFMMIFVFSLILFQIFLSSSQLLVLIISIYVISLIVLFLISLGLGFIYIFSLFTNSTIQKNRKYLKKDFDFIDFKKVLIKERIFTHYVSFILGSTISIIFFVFRSSIHFYIFLIFLIITLEIPVLLFLFLKAKNLWYKQINDRIESIYNRLPEIEFYTSTRKFKGKLKKIYENEFFVIYQLKNREEIFVPIKEVKYVRFLSCQINIR